MTKDEAIESLDAVARNFRWDPESAHGAAENILLAFLDDNGYQDLANKYLEVRDSVGFWYA